MAFASPARVVAEIYALLGRPSQVRLPARDVHAARIESGMEILRAISMNPKGGYYGSLASLVTIGHNQFLPAHDGEPGVPVIVAFPNAPAREGIPDDPDNIDAYRDDALGLYTSALGDPLIPHDQPDDLGTASPVARRYSIVNGRFKFTGYSAQIPLIQLTRAMADTGVPETFEPTLVKLSIPKLVKEGDNLAQIASAYGQMGMNDLALIADGARSISPVPDIVTAQKAVI